MADENQTADLIAAGGSVCLSTAATPALAASAGSELPDLTTAGVDENNSVVSIRLTADGDLTYGSPLP